MQFRFISNNLAKGGYMDICNQRGFSLIEVSIVTAIVLLIAVIGIPAINGYVMENRVPKVGEELAKFVMQMKVNADASGELPYADISTDYLNNVVTDSPVLSRTANGQILHGLGSGGTVTLAELENGEGFALTLNDVNHVACPSIASVLQRMANIITVNNGSDTRTLKDHTNQYNALAAEAGCKNGNVNRFVFNIY